MTFFYFSIIIILENKKGDFKMKIVKNVTGSGRLPSEFVQMNNWNCLYEEVESNNLLLIEFVECFGGHYKDNVCEWKVEEIA